MESVSSPAPVVPQVKSISCPNCGGSVTLRGYAQSVNAVCIQCLSVIDVKSPSLQVLQTFQSKERFRPLIPLGSRGQFDGTTFEVIGFQVRQIVVEGVEYRWNEYLLFNPYRGYRYISEYDGHWNVIRTVHVVPKFTTKSGKRAVEIQGTTYTHFQSANAETVFVMGEFPWQVRFGDRVKADDYVSPPGMASSEGTDQEETWSVGQYTPGKQIWETFKLPGSPPTKKGIFSNEPSPHGGRVRSIWKLYAALMVGLFGLALVVGLMNQNKEVFRQRYSFQKPTFGEPSFVTPVFELKASREASVEVEVQTDLDNDWAYFSFALINDDTGVAYNFGNEVSYYHGRDSDGNWSEGGKTDSVTIPSVPPGRYYLRVEPEMDDAQGAASQYSIKPAHTVVYDLIVRHDVPRYWMFFVAAVLLLIPPIFATFRAFQFENARWAESDYGALVTSSSSDGDDD